jgi:transposase
MRFDLTQPSPKPTTFAECHQLIDRLWMFARHTTEKLNCDSTNSSLSPAQDSFKSSVQKSKKKAPWQWRTLAFWKKRKQGTQVGHKGTGRKLLSTESVDTVSPCYPRKDCPHCCFGTVNVKRICQRKQVFDLILKGVHIIEYQVYDGRCIACKKCVKGKLPTGLPRGILTETSLSKITLLVAQYRLLRREIKQLLADFFDLHICIGTISNAESWVSEAMTGTVSAIEKQLKASDYARLDETSHRRSGQTEWLWVACNEKASLFKIFDSRAQSSAKALIGEYYQGMAITDRYGAYSFLSSLQRQYCWVHLKRDFVRLSEKLNPQEAFIGQCLLSTMRRIFYWYHQLESNKMSTAKLFLMRQIKRFYGYLKKGIQLTDTRTARFCAKLLRERKSLWHFLKKPTIEPTNNLAERNLRHAVLWRKKTFGTRSVRGNQFVERMLTVMMTAKQLGENIIQELYIQLNLNKKVWASL